jgi:signal transduction histidine kinase
VWAPTLLRILLALAVADAQYAADGQMLHMTGLVLAGWGIASIGWLLVVHPLQKQHVQIQFGLDVAAAALASWAAPNTLVHALALVAGSAQLLFRSGFPIHYLAALLVPIILAPVRAKFSNGELASLASSASGNLFEQTVFALAILTTGASIAIAASRADQLRQFAEQAASITMLKLGRSLEFDLQRLIEEIASLFTPGRAHCLIGEASQRATPRRYDCGTPLNLSEHDLRRLLGLGHEIGQSEVLLDGNARSIYLGAQGKPVPMSEKEQAVAKILAREGISLALLKWVQIGRSRGVVICALTWVDAVKLYELSLVTGALNQLFPLLDSISDAERQFIADAHDVARRDLHDGVLQTLAAVRMRLLSTSKRADLKQHPGSAEIRKIADILTLEQARLRGLLETSEDEEHGINLVTRLDVSLRAISMQWDIDARLESEEPAIPIDKESAINIEHLVREAVANAVRHAESKELTVRLSLHHNAMHIVIIDRAGPVTGDKAKKRGTSMPLKSASLQHRLRLVNGSAYQEGLESSAILSVTIPMQRVDNA